jgi:ABC-type tungstate transport system substrate-binding protein
MPVDESGNMRPTRLMEKVSRYIEANPNASRNNIVEAKFGKKAYVVRAIDRLIQEGWIEVVVGARNTHNHRVITAFREGSDTTPDHPQGALDV